MNQLARRLTQCILQSGYSVREIAGATGIRPSTLYSWMKGCCSPGAHSLRQLCQALGVSADWLLGLKDGYRERDDA